MQIRLDIADFTATKDGLCQASVHQVSLELASISVHGHGPMRMHELSSFLKEVESSEPQPDGRKKLALRAHRAAVSMLELLDSITPAKTINNMSRPADEHPAFPVMTISNVLLGVDAEMTVATGRNRYYFTLLDFAHGDDSNSYVFSCKQFLHIVIPPVSLSHLHLDDIHAIGSLKTFIVCGMCIYNKSIIEESYGRSIDGSLLVDCLWNTPPTMYEADFITRLSSTIADLAGMLTSRRTLNKPVICLDIPNFHYYYSILALLESHCCNPAEALRWVTAIDHRSRQISLVLKRAIDNECRKRHMPEASYVLRSATKARSIAHLVKESLKQFSIPSLTTLLRSLEGSDPVWNIFIDLLPPRKQPTSFKGLGLLLHVFETVKPALTQQVSLGADLDACNMNNLSGSRTIIFGVDDPSERPIYSESQALLRSVRQRYSDKATSDLIEVYMCPRLFINGKWEKHFFNYDTSGACRDFLSSKPAADFSEQVRPYDIIAGLYGRESSENINTWFREVGL